eukprot:3895347-Rhodomonas_salina.1
MHQPHRNSSAYTYPGTTPRRDRRVRTVAERTSVCCVQAGTELTVFAVRSDTGRRSRVRGLEGGAGDPGGGRPLRRVQPHLHEHPPGTPTPQTSAARC